MKIAIIGIGYVGLANAITLSKHHDVCIVDIVQEKVDLIRDKNTPFKEKLISKL